MSDAGERLEGSLEPGEARYKKDLGEGKRSRERELRCGDLGTPPQGLDKAREELQRLERISERDSMRFTRDFDPRKVRELEALEIKLSPEAFASRHRNEGLDSATRREICESLERRDLKRH